MKADRAFALAYELSRINPYENVLVMLDGEIHPHKPYRFYTDHHFAQALVENNDQAEIVLPNVADVDMPLWRLYALTASMEPGSTLYINDWKHELVTINEDRIWVAVATGKKLRSPWQWVTVRWAPRPEYFVITAQVPGIIAAHEAIQLMGSTK